MKSLTDKGIAALKPMAKDTFKSDGNGLYVRVRATGRKTFVYRSKLDGTANWESLGDYPVLTVREARELAKERATRTRLPKKLVQEAYEVWFAKAIAAKYKQPGNVSSRMLRHFIPYFGTRQIMSLTRSELCDHLIDLADKTPFQANRVLSDIKLLLQYAKNRGWVENNVLYDVTPKIIGGRENSRTRMLSDTELRDFMTFLLDSSTRNSEAVRFALAIALITGQRSGMVRGLQASQVQGDKWIIPPHLKKNEASDPTPHIVYLNPGAAAVFKACFATVGDHPFKGMDGQTLARATERFQDEKYGFKSKTQRWVPHDFRRTMSTTMGNLGVLPHIGEKCLSHKMTGVMAVYNLAEYPKEKRAAWRLWEKHLLKLYVQAKKSPHAEG